MDILPNQSVFVGVAYLGELPIVEARQRAPNRYEVELELIQEASSRGTARQYEGVDSETLGRFRASLRERATQRNVKLHVRAGANGRRLTAWVDVNHRPDLLHGARQPPAGVLSGINKVD
jgi:hypothetical protein